MVKKSIGSILNSGIESASKKGGLNMNETIITTPDRLKKIITKEKKEAKSMVYLTNKDMNNFLEKIGREPFSEAVGILIKEFILSGKNIKDIKS